jgi:predicted nucleotidyltransferase component of viral defense system
MTGKKYSTPFAFRRALEDRLKVKSQEQGTDFQRVRRSVAFDRLLCRLFVPGGEPWLLKGGYAMELRIQSARVTKDIDLTLPAGIPPGEFCGISKEDQFAEKLHAYTRPREGRSNSRVKDLIDMVLLIDLGLESARLRKALEKTFARRNSHPLPPSLDAPPEFWPKPYEALARECGLSGDITNGFKRVSDFYDLLG